VLLGQDNLVKLARRLFRTKLTSKTRRNWSPHNWAGPVARFLVGQLDEERLRALVCDVPVLHERELCQAEFYIGVRAIQLGDTVAAKRAFRRAAQLDAAKIENEYYLAKHEATRRGPRRSGGAS
jgi:hypothetical protein